MMRPGLEVWFGPKLGGSAGLIPDSSICNTIQNTSEIQIQINSNLSSHLALQRCTCDIPRVKIAISKRLLVACKIKKKRESKRTETNK